jgi:hypothetical protein
MPRGNSYESITAIDAIPTFETTPVFDADHSEVPGFKGIRRLDTRRIVAVQSERYGLVQHREVAEKVMAVAKALEVPTEEIYSEDMHHHFAPTRLRMFDMGRSFEYRLVVPKKYNLSTGESFYPGLRVTNSVNGKLAVTVSGFALRLACTNQLAAAVGDISDVRELHLTSAENLMGAVEKGIYEFLSKFDGTMTLYQQAMDRRMKAVDVEFRLVDVKMPERHAKAIAGSVLALNSPEVTAWDAYQAATEYITHGVDVSPARERTLERAAARALLLEPEEERTPTEEDAAEVA